MAAETGPAPPAPVLGKWPRPAPGCEASRHEKPLELLYCLSAAPALWRPLVIDEDRRCYSFLWPRAISSEESQSFFERLLVGAPWVELRNTKGTSVTRSTCWYTCGGCTCEYTYGKGTRIDNGGVEARPQSQRRESDSNGEATTESASSDSERATGNPEEFRRIMHDVTAHVFGNLFPGLGEEAWPNSANLNLYHDGRKAVGWHADDESLFRGKERDCPIVSVSLGTPRELWIALKKADGMDPDPKTILEVDLKDGDVLTMEGRMQQHCVHIVPKGNPREPIRQERINITFRWIRDHRFHCPLHRRRKQQIPRELRGIFGEAKLWHPGDRETKDAIVPRGPLHLGPSYIRCWSREIQHGVLADPERIELRLCDACKHLCCEEGRPCCEGRNEWEGNWFCRRCWAKWEPDSVPELPPHGPLMLPPPVMPPLMPDPLQMLGPLCGMYPPPLPWGANPLADGAPWPPPTMLPPPPQPHPQAGTAVSNTGDQESAASGFMATFPPLPPFPRLPIPMPPPPPWLHVQEGLAGMPGGFGASDMGSPAAAAALQQMHTAQAIYALTWAGTLGASPMPRNTGLQSASLSTLARPWVPKVGPTPGPHSDA